MLGNVLDTNARLVEAGMDADFYVRHGFWPQLFYSGSGSVRGIRCLACNCRVLRPEPQTERPTLSGPPIIKHIDPAKNEDSRALSKKYYNRFRKVPRRAGKVLAAGNQALAVGLERICYYSDFRIDVLAEAIGQREIAGAQRIQLIQSAIGDELKIAEAGAYRFAGKRSAIGSQRLLEQA